MKPFDDEDLGGLDELWRVEQPGDVVVDGLIHGLPFLESLNLLVHQVEVVGPRVERGDALLLPPGPVEGVVVVEADHGGGVADEGVGVGVPAPRGLRRAAKHAGEPPHEGALPAPGVSGQADHHRVASGRAPDHEGGGAGQAAAPAASRGSGLPVEEDLLLLGEAQLWRRDEGLSCVKCTNCHC